MGPMPDGVDALRQGTIGYFWPIRDRIPNLNEDVPERGHAQIEDGWVTVNVLDENVEEGWFSDYDEPAPPAVVALIPEGAAVLLEVLGPFRTRRSGVRASSARYRTE